MFLYPKHYDVIVVGGGHAGVEAALAAARMGATTLLLTINPDTIAQMSCNPAIGGLAKGHLVREIDALGGEMGKTTDFTGLQFRMLNLKKGPAVWAPRAQCDKKAYQFRMKWTCEQQPRLDVRAGQVVSITTDIDRVTGVETDFDVRFTATVVIITTGTFLRGLMHMGTQQRPGGRTGDPAATGLSESLERLGFEIGRLKTGTPPRIHRRSIDFERTERQGGDDPIPFFTYWRDDLFHVEHSDSDAGNQRQPSGEYPPGSILALNGGQEDCFVTYTTDTTRQLIRANLSRSPLYSGAIEGVGPRYCPSIEDKVVKFANKERHQIFLEPEGINTEEIYVNGLSTSLPYDVQIDLVRSIIGCEKAEIIRPAYAVEYDFSNPTQLHASLETKVCRNLYFAGQINGTSGYEEAAAQGLMAGINAALRIDGREPIVLRRDQAYIGVLIDDLVTKGTTEPYRMFTSRAEFRILLRQDNAHLRLSGIGNRIGLISTTNYHKVSQTAIEVNAELVRLRKERSEGVTLDQILRRPEISYSQLPSRNVALSQEVATQVELEVKYAGYIERQRLDAQRLESLESKEIPAWLDYDSIGGLRRESRQKLISVRPRTIAQALRISGVSPADISLVLVWMKRGRSDSCAR